MTENENFGDVSDQTLLRQYVKQRSEAAFTQIMRRHYSLVYSVCKREVGDADLAQDVSYAVFMILAQRASTLRGGTGLAGWLFQTARFASKNALRQEQRRIQREQKGQEMLRLEPSAEGTSSDVWEMVEPHLHTVLSRLAPDDREAILLRFFEECSFAEIGVRLEVSDNTARMRVTRALEKMRRHLAHAGIALTTAVIATLLAQKAAVAAPTVAFSKPMLAGEPHLLSQAATRSHHLMQGVVTAMKIKTSVVIAASVLVLLGFASTGIFLVQKQQRASFSPQRSSFSPQEAANHQFSPQEAANLRSDFAVACVNSGKYKAKTTNEFLMEFANRQNNPYSKNVMLGVRERLGEGDSYEEAFAKFPQVFDKDYISKFHLAQRAKNRAEAISIMKPLEHESLN